MAFGSKASRPAISLIALAGLTLAAADVSVSVRHGHAPLRGTGSGSVTVNDDGIQYHETGKRAEKHDWKLAWDDIQQVWVSPQEIRIATYKDVWWKLGADRELELKAAPGASFDGLYALLRTKLGEKLVAAVAPELSDVLWGVPVKLRSAFGGSEGVLQVARDRVAYRSKEKAASRTWTLADIENVSSSGRFDLTITTFERSKSGYGDRRSFNFQLKQPLDERKFDTLWREINRSKQMDFISSIQERDKQ